MVSGPILRSLAPSLLRPRPRFSSTRDADAAPLVRRFPVLFLRRLANHNMSLYAQLDELERCGITPSFGIGVAELLVAYAERQYEKDPFRLLLMALGGELNDPPHGLLSENVWHLRVGSIAGPGDYARIALRMAILAQGNLPITEVADEIDYAAGLVWLSFRLGDEQVSWPARIREHWIDPDLFSRFALLLEAQDTPRRFTYLDLGGQDALLGCATPRQFADLRRRTGLSFQWLG